MLSAESRTAAMPPCALSLAPSIIERFAISATRRVLARLSATDSPARPLPTIATSNFMLHLHRYALDLVRSVGHGRGKGRAYRVGPARVCAKQKAPHVRGFLVAVRLQKPEIT